MPIYEYVCRACAHEFEALVFRSERPACPRCAAEELEKRFSSFAAPSSRPASVGPAAPGSCGTCGDPRGPGACAIDA